MLLIIKLSIQKYFKKINYRWTRFTSRSISTGRGIASTGRGLSSPTPWYYSLWYKHKSNNIKLHRFKLITGPYLFLTCIISEVYFQYYPACMHSGCSTWCSSAYIFYQCIRYFFFSHSCLPSSLSLVKFFVFFCFLQWIAFPFF